MRVNERIRCDLFPCQDVTVTGYGFPDLELDPERVRVVLISECAAPDPGESYYAPGEPLFARTTIQAFQDAGAAVSSLQDILGLGVYLTTAIKCAKLGYAIDRRTVLACSELLERELEQFPAVRAYLLMGDVAIAAVNAIARRRGEPRVIPAGATYKIRGGEFRFRGARAFPSYLQAGPSFYIEKSKRRAIAEDITAALAVAGLETVTA